MDDNASNEDAQHSDEPVSDNGHSGDGDSFAPIYGEFDTATEFLNSLDGRLADERDKLRGDGQVDEVVADAILGLKAEADSLRFSAVPVGHSGAMSITAWIVTDAGDEAIDVYRLDPADVSKRIDFAERLSAIHPAIKAVAAERKLMQLAAELAQPQQNEMPSELTSEMLLQEMPEQVRAEARAMLEDPDLMSRIVEDVQALGVAGEAELIATTYLSATSRLLPEPVKVIVSSPSSTGKTITVRNTTSCIPPEQVINANSITAQVLYYLGLDNPDALKHRLIVSGERKKQQSDEQADATSAIRQMLSEGRISKLFTDTSVKPPAARYVVINGPISFIETTTSVRSEIFDEDLNRCLLLSADERPEQTRLVIKRIAETKRGAKLVDADAIRERHHAAQRMLQQRPVIIPFADRLADNFNSERPEARRAFGQLCGMIEASALLHQFQRPIDEDGRIVATLVDYEIAADLSRPPLARLLGGKISDAAIRFHERLLKWEKAQPKVDVAGNDIPSEFSTTDAWKHDGRSDSAVLGWLKELVSIGAVEQVEASRGSRAARWRLTDMTHVDVEAGGFDLPAVSELVDDDADPADPDSPPF